MSFWKLVLRNLTHHRRVNLAVALGVAAATAVLTGALLVGDSMRGSLRHMALDRLGRIDEVLVTSHFFREELSEELFQGESSAKLREHYEFAVATALFPQGTVEHESDQQDLLRGSNVLVVGSTDDFWKLTANGPKPGKLPGPGEAIINQALADELRAKAGDQITLRLPNTEQQVNPDNPLSDNEDRISSIPQLKVVAVIPVEGLGRFSLRPSQSAPRNIYVHLDTLRESLDVEGRANAIFVAGKNTSKAASKDASRILSDALKPTFEDYGLLVKHVQRNFTPKGQTQAQTAFEYFSVSTVQMVLPDNVAGAATDAFRAFNAQSVSTYLANALYKPTEKGQPPSNEQVVPYSMISGIGEGSPLGPAVDANGKSVEIGDDEIVLIDWAAGRMKAKVGDTIRLAYFEPETTHGKAVERTRDFRLKAIIATTQPSQAYRPRRAARFTDRPTLANDPDLTPEVPGVTDADSIGKWQTPFELTWHVNGADDDFWRYYRTTPKAFVSLATAKALWGSRFGTLTSFRIPPADKVTPDVLKDSLLAEVRRQKLQLGFTFIPIKRRSLSASSGTTPFDVLFLALSFFIIVAALMLVSLLFRLGIEQRAEEIGTLLAVGLRRRRAARALIAEGFLVAACGALLGLLIGVGYAQLMLLGLNTWWIDAVTTRFLTFHWTIQTLAIGYVAGVAVSLLTIAWSVRQTRHVSVRQLMAGQGNLVSEWSAARGRWASILAYVLLASAIGLAVMATQLGGEAQAGAFVGGGAAVLTALLLLIWIRFRRARTGSLPAMSMGGLAMSSAGRNPGRSTTTIGLMAFACFLIVGMSSFQVSATKEGQGGFDLVAETSQPFNDDLNDADIRDELFGKEGEKLKESRIFAFRVQAGDDASCNNLYQSTQPRVLGVTPAFIDSMGDLKDGEGFRFAKSAAVADDEIDNPWRVLRQGEDDENDGAIPMILDKNTAMYSLQLYGGVGQRFTIEYEDGQKVVFRVAGLLSGSILQGSLLIDEARFEKVYPNTGGYRYFLIKSAGGPDLASRSTAATAALLENRLGDWGFDARRADELLSQLLAVQNTYLSTFQSLGALGLLLGTLGLATVQVRNVVERRRELALLRAEGFAKSRLAKLVMLENLVLLLGGMFTGILAALLSVLPHMIFGGASVPFRDLGIMMALVVLAGVTAALFAISKTMKAPLLSALRGD